MSSAPTTTRRTAPASATISTFSDLARAHLDALAHLRRGGDAPLTLNCGYGRGYSVLEVIDTVKRVSGVDFEVDVRGPPARRPGADRGRLRPHPRHPELAAAIRRSRHHRHAFAGMGARSWRRGRAEPLRPARFPLELPGPAWARTTRRRTARPARAFGIAVGRSASAQIVLSVAFRRSRRRARAGAPTDGRTGVAAMEALPPGASA